MNIIIVVEENNNNLDKDFISQKKKRKPCTLGVHVQILTLCCLCLYSIALDVYEYS
jgi:hypothetical protein